MLHKCLSRKHTILELWPQPDTCSGAEPLWASSAIALPKSPELWQLKPTGAVPFLCTILVKLTLHHTQSPGSVTITVWRAPQTPSCTTAHRGQGERLDFHPDLGFMRALTAMTWTKTLNTACSDNSKPQAQPQQLPRLWWGMWTHGHVPRSSVTPRLACSPPALHWYSGTIIYHQTWPLGLYELSVLERRETTFYIQHNRYLDIVDQ